MIDYSNETINKWARLGMRKAFGEILSEIADDDPDLLVLAADVASSGNLSVFNNRHPDQFFNIGIAEQNMTGIACGLAKEGNTVFFIFFSPFVSLRNYEAIRTLIGYMHLNVKIVALAGGMSLSVQGNTHYTLEDIALMCSIPGMTVLSPADVKEEAKCLEYMAANEGPMYLRLTGIDGSPVLLKEDDPLWPEVPSILREGEDIAILSTGSITSECIRTARLLKKEGLSCAVYDTCRLKPINREWVKSMFADYRLVVTVEEHFAVNGLGSIISNINSQMDQPGKMLIIGIDDMFPHVGDYAWLLENNHINAAHLRDRIMTAVQK